MKRKLQKLCFLLSILSCLTPIQAQDIKDTIIANFNLLELIPEEKLYLHTDKPFYSAGERIWFKGYLVNAHTHLDDSKSNFIITELINQSDSILTRKKIRRDSLGNFHNAFELPPTLPEGDYYLRGYTNWMLNEDPDFFFQRNLKIGNAIDNSILSTIEYRKKDENHYVARIKFSGNNGQTSFAETRIHYIYVENGKIEDRGKTRTNEEGYMEIELPDLTQRAERRIEVTFDDPTYVYHKTFYLPVFNRDFHISFFPEGGAALAIPQQNIAFKAQGADGLSVNVKCVLYNAKGDSLTSFASEHDGMGVFTLYNHPKENDYHVIATAENGMQKRFELPHVENKGIALSMTHHRNQISFNIQKTDSTQWPDKMFLAAHTRERLRLLLPITSKSLMGLINDTIFQAGITHFLLIDGEGRTLSERLIFVPDRKPAHWEIRTDKPYYSRREKVALRIKAHDFDGKPLKGNYSISITDRSKLCPDSLADHIASNLLLTSDLKGHIENPGYYFRDQSNRTLHNMDVLLMTHGWRRHKLKNLAQLPTMSFPNYIESGQTISGKIKGFFGKDVKKGPIYILAPQKSIFTETTTDDNGEFIADISFPDSTVFAIQARTKRGFAGVDIVINEPPYPAASHKSPFSHEMPLQMEEYLQNTKSQYYTEGGMPVINLKEVVITSKGPRPSQRSMYTSGINTYTIEGEKLENYGSMTVYEMARRLPGVMESGGTLHVRNNPDNPAIVIDDIVYDYDSSILYNLLVDNISSISLVRGTDTTILGPRANAGAIVITLKSPQDIPLKPARGIITYQPLGYSEEIEFYHPVYDTPEKKADSKSDLRSTLYWNPALTLDENGETTVEYYTSDSDAPQDIVIEGIDHDGNASHVHHIINLHTSETKTETLR